MILYRSEPVQSIVTHYTEWFWEGCDFTPMKTLYHPGYVTDADDEDMKIIYIELVWGMVKT